MLNPRFEYIATEAKKLTLIEARRQRCRQARYERYLAVVELHLSFPLNHYNGSTDSKDVSRFLNSYNCAVLNTIIP